MADLAGLSGLLELKFLNMLIRVRLESNPILQNLRGLSLEGSSVAFHEEFLDQPSAWSSLQSLSLQRAAVTIWYRDLLTSYWECFDWEWHSQVGHFMVLPSLADPT